MNKDEIIAEKNKIYIGTVLEILGRTGNEKNTKIYRFKRWYYSMQN